jgi:hypothetical protein
LFQTGADRGSGLVTAASRTVTALLTLREKVIAPLVTGASDDLGITTMPAAA